MADFGEILRNIGEFGLFQQVLLLALALPNSWNQFLSIYFVQLDPERHCNTDWILAVHPNLSKEEQLNLTVPRQEDGTFSRCLMFVPVDWNITSIRELGLNETTSCQDGWVYSSTLYKATIITDFDLVCDRARLFHVVQTVGMVGSIIGSVLSGPLADLFGRKRMVQTSYVLIVTFSATSVTCHNIYLYLICLFLMGVGNGGYDLNTMILATEWMGISKRSWPAVVNGLFATVGQCIITGVIYVVRDWRLTQSITSALCAVSCIYIWLIPESARWLLIRGRTDEAKQLICKVAKINKRSPPQFQQGPTVETTPERKTSLNALFKTSVLRKFFLIVTAVKFSLLLSHSSISFNVSKFGMDIFLTMLLFNVTELPTLILSTWLLEVLGRKISLILTLLIAGFFCAIIAFVSQSDTTAVTLLATSGRLFTSWASTVASVYIQELFPTTIRQTAVGLSTFISRMSPILAPSLNAFAKNDISIPTLICGSLMFVSCALSILLPETRRRELPESVSEVVDNRTERTDAGKDTGEESQSSRL